MYRYLLPLCLTLAACSKPSAPDAPPAKPTTKTQVAPTKAAPVTQQQKRIEVLDGQGKTLFSLKVKEGGYKLLDAAGQTIGKVKIEADRVKVKDSSGTLKAKIKQKDYGFKLEGPAETLLYKGKKKDGGKLKVKNGQDQVIAVFKGQSVEIGGKNYQTANNAGTIEVKGDGKLNYQVKGYSRLEPTLTLLLPGLDTYQRAALLTFLLKLW